MNTQYSASLCTHSPINNITVHEPNLTTRVSPWSLLHHTNRLNKQKSKTSTVSYQGLVVSYTHHFDVWCFVRGKKKSQSSSMEAVHTSPTLWHRDLLVATSETMLLVTLQQHYSNKLKAVAIKYSAKERKVPLLCLKGNKPSRLQPFV